MFQELICHHVEKKQKRYLFLGKQTYRIGKALDNDIVLLDADALPYLATLEKSDLSYIWIQQEQQTNLKGQNYKTNGYIFSIRDHRIGVYALIFSFMVWLSFVFFQGWFGHVPSYLLKSQSLPARGVYGGSASIQSVEFDFQPHPPKFSVLHYTPGNIADADNIEIMVNGKLLGFAPASPGKWNTEVSLPIPPDLMKEGSNKIGFLQSGDKQQPWAVKDIFIEDVDTLPSQVDGVECLKNAQKLLRERKVRRGNLIRAEQVVKQAIQYYRSQQKQPLLALTDLADQIAKEKLQMIQDHQLLAQKYRREGEPKKAGKVFQKLLDELVDPMDPDRIVVEREIQELHD
jgi:hypothetical protein